MEHALTRGVALRPLAEVSVQDTVHGAGIEGIVGGEWHVRIGSSDYVFGDIASGDDTTPRASAAAAGLVGVGSAESEIPLARKIDACMGSVTRSGGGGGGHDAATDMASELAAYFSIQRTCSSTPLRSAATHPHLLNLLPAYRHRKGSCRSVLALSVPTPGGSQGWICCVDQIRPGSQELIRQLQRNHGMRCLILSGDRTVTLKRIADKLGAPPPSVGPVWQRERDACT